MQMARAGGELRAANFNLPDASNASEVIFVVRALCRAPPPSLPRTSGCRGSRNCLTLRAFGLVLAMQGRVVARIARAGSRERATILIHPTQPVMGGQASWPLLYKTSPIDSAKRLARQCWRTRTPTSTDFSDLQASLAGNLDQPAFLAGFSIGLTFSRRYESTPNRRSILCNLVGRSGTASAAGTITGATVSERTPSCSIAQPPPASTLRHLHDHEITIIEVDRQNRRSRTPRHRSLPEQIVPSPDKPTPPMATAHTGGRTRKIGAIAEKRTRPMPMSESGRGCHMDERSNVPGARRD